MGRVQVLRVQVSVHPHFFKPVRNDFVTVTEVRDLLLDLFVRTHVRHVVTCENARRNVHNVDRMGTATADVDDLEVGFQQEEHTRLQGFGW